MTTWKADLIFDNRINNRKNKLKFTFPVLYNYNTLYNNLITLFKCIGWKPIKYGRNCIDFQLLTYRDNPMSIDDWNNYILNRDIIQIVIFDPRMYYYGLYTTGGVKLMVSKNIKTIYDDIKMEFVRQTLLIYLINESGIQLKLIDVLDNPKVYYNQVVNRLVHNYYELYHIII